MNCAEKVGVTMTVEEVILQEGVIRRNTPAFPVIPIDLVIQAVCSEKNIVLKSIATDYVFPRVLTIGGVHHLIWDQTYWQLYYDYLLAFADFNSELSPDNMVFYKDSARSTIQYVFANYLALVVKDPAVAANFAAFYHFGQNGSHVYRLGMSIEDLQDYIETGKLFTAIHEQYHVILKKDELRECTEMTFAVQSMGIITKLVENMKDSFVEDKYFMSKDELLSIISDASRNKKLLVDIMCDTYAFNTCLAIFRESWKNRMSDIEIVTRCLEGIRVLSYFNATLLGLRIFWQGCECQIEKLKLYQKTVVRRTYLSEFMSILQLNAQNLDGHEYKSLWKFCNFENNYKFESLLFSYFFTDDAVQKWRMPGSTIETKFELLNWRI